MFQRPFDRYGEKPYQIRQTKKNYLTTKRLNARLNTQNERRLDKGASQKTATALGLATHYYKSVDSDMLQNWPFNDGRSEETR